MAVVTRYYLAPYQQGYIPARPQAYASKIILYKTDNTISDIVQVAPFKLWCLQSITDDEAIHEGIQADEAPGFPTGEIKLIPFWDGDPGAGGEYLPLTATVSEVAALYRSQMQTFLEDRRVPTGWIDGSDQLGEVITYIIKLFFTVNNMRRFVGDVIENDYPEFSLDLTVAEIEAGHRARIQTWMSNNGIETSDITGAWTVRQILRRIIVQYPFGPIDKFGVALL